MFLLKLSTMNTANAASAASLQPLSCHLVASRCSKRSMLLLLAARPRRWSSRTPSRGMPLSRANQPSSRWADVLREPRAAAVMDSSAYARASHSGLRSSSAAACLLLPVTTRPSTPISRPASLLAPASRCTDSGPGIWASEGASPASSARRGTRASASNALAAAPAARHMPLITWAAGGRREGPREGGATTRWQGVLRPQQRPRR
jgi:hypothetical protein